MANRRGDSRVHPAWWTLVMLISISAFVLLCSGSFVGWFNAYVPITLRSDRSGLVMESGGKVKMRGVLVGRVSAIAGGVNEVSLKLAINPDEIKYIPANIEARIRATTAFGAKYVDLIYPANPSRRRLAAGAVIKSQNVSTEVNTVFQNLTSLLKQIDPAKLNGVLSALSEGLRGEGPIIGQATTDANQVLLALNPRAETVRRDWQALKGFSDTYGAAAQHIMMVLDAASTTSGTIVSQSQALDSLLIGVLGFARSGISLVGPSKDNLVRAVNILEPSTRLLMKYNPQLTCMLTGAKEFLDGAGGYDIAGGHNGNSLIVDAALLMGDDPYRYPDNLPIVGAKGGPDGKPSCGSLPDVAKDWPMRYLVTNTGWGTGLDLRPNPGIGFPGYADYLPVTRAIPEPPSIRHPAGPAPGPMPYPGAPPYGAPLYAPDGTPLYPGLPSAPPPGAPREPGPPPGSEPFAPPNPAPVQPTPPPPLPGPAVPSP